MTADQFIQYLTWSVYVLIFLLVLSNALRRPIRPNVDIALFFAVPAIIVAFSVASMLQMVPAGALPNAILTVLLVSISYMLLRLVDDFSDVPGWLMRGSEVALALLVVGTFAFKPPRPGWFSILQLIYILAPLIYTIAAFMREARRSSGVTKRRIRAVAAGSIFLFLIFFIAGIALFFPELVGITAPLSELCGLASGIAYFIGFATPSILRRAWQEPELRAFLGRAASLPRLPDTASIISEMERGVASSLGVPGASIAIWDDGKQVLKSSYGGKQIEMAPVDTMASGRAFLTQTPVLMREVQPDNPAYASAIQVGVKALLAAPITAGTKRLGTLLAYAPHTPMFADEDLALVQLLADQAAVIMESRALIDEAARVRAQEEVTRLKDDFLSAAAHDLKTPLTTLIAQSELLERKALRNPDAPADLGGLQKLKKEAHRLNALVRELLDATRTEQGRLVEVREEIDLAASAREVCEHNTSERHPCIVEAHGLVVGLYDGNRILQLIENLVENAVKYSPDGGPVRVGVWNEDGRNHLTVADTGIGIPKEDLAHVFERFHRGTNVNDRRFAGMGLGLFICKGIVEQHGGRIWVDQSGRESSNRNNGDEGRIGSSAILNSNHTNHNDNGRTDHAGTTFHVEFPALVPATAASVPSEAEAAGDEARSTIA